jgi:hypothetical protein
VDERPTTATQAENVNSISLEELAARAEVDEDYVSRLVEVGPSSHGPTPSASDVGA